MISTEKIMLVGELGKPFKLAVDETAEILRAGIDPATGQPAVWVLYDSDNPIGPEYRHMVVVATGMKIPVGSVHRGMWWAAAETFHLFELENPEDATFWDDIADTIAASSSPGVGT